MMSLEVIFWMFVIIFAVIGGLRGWAKEILVSFSVILALAINQLLRKYVPLVANMPENDKNLFWLREIILGTMVFFGYQTVLSVPRFASRAAREKLQDSLFGGFLGAINGWLIAGSAIYYYVVAGYPFPNVIAAPTDPTMTNTINQMMTYMPPAVFGEPLIYFMVMLAFVFVLIVYI
jgi:uncharacterized membrane protein required for colicin V production